jgi:hypothetical protein
VPHPNVAPFATLGWDSTDAFLLDPAQSQRLLRSQQLHIENQR